MASRSGLVQSIYSERNANKNSSGPKESDPKYSSQPGKSRLQKSIERKKIMSKFIGVLLLVALAVRLVTLFFFKQNAVLNEISLVLFISIFVVTVIVMLVKWWKWRTK